MKPILAGILFGLILMPIMLLAQIIVTPSQKLYWDQDASSLLEANQYRMTAYTGINADKARVNPNDVSLVGGISLTFTCANPVSPYRCTSTTTAQTLAGTILPGDYKVTIVAERRKADGTYAPKVASLVCDFRFQDNNPSLAPTNLGFSN